jgi:hypothetical protein
VSRAGTFLRRWIYDANDKPEAERATARQAGYNYRCPCGDWHSVRTEGSGAWAFDGNLAAPTFSPSVLVTYNGKDAGQSRPGIKPAPAAVCHSFVRAGKVEFLADCTHALAGKIVPMIPLSDDAEPI